MKNHLTLFAVFLSALSLNAAIKSGPMLGACDMREASVWLQCEPKESVAIKYLSENGEIKIEQQADNDGICRFVLGGLTPGGKHKYSIEINGEKAAEGEAVTFPDIKDRTPPSEFSVAIAGKNHFNDKTYDEPFKTPGAEFEIYDAIAAKAPMALVWANNIASLRPADWGSRNGIFGRYSHERAAKPLQELLKSAPNYGVLGVESFGAPRSDKRFILKSQSQDAFKSFWTNFNTSMRTPGTSFFRIQDAEFFILDDASCRNNLDIGAMKREYLGAEQLEWLMVSLKNSTATFKVVIMNSPMLNPVENADNFVYAKDERKRFLEFILEQKIGGIVFASANKDFGEITRFVRAGAAELFEITAGPLTARPAKAPTEVNYFRLTSSAITKRSFAMMHFGGKEGARTLKLEFFDSAGKSIFSHTLAQANLYRFGL